MAQLEMWSVGILSASCIVTIFRMILPSDMTGGGIGFALNLLVFLTVLSPITGIMAEEYDFFVEDTSAIVAFSTEVYEENQLQQLVAQEVLDFLQKYGINSSDPRIDITMTTVGEKGATLFLSLPQEYSGTLSQLSLALEGYFEIPVIVTTKE